MTDKNVRIARGEDDFEGNNICMHLPINSNICSQCSFSSNKLLSCFRISFWEYF